MENCKVFFPPLYTSEGTGPDLPKVECLCAMVLPTAVSHWCPKCSPSGCTPSRVSGSLEKLPWECCRDIPALGAQPCPALPCPAVILGAPSWQDWALQAQLVPLEFQQGSQQKVSTELALPAPWNSSQRGNAGPKNGALQKRSAGPQSN